ncbi:TIGD4-like protein [Mya arenaria]|uniref:TIGD4-like protein n=1 Tax=Mya arenaria TaxID=6604 RepID=A0ABY7E373_MYAAR|nr:TIGD4-like protein [Mya arenaria]
MDESGLFYRESSRSTFYMKGEDCADGKRAKERLTVAPYDDDDDDDDGGDGQKLKPVVIGKARKPRCFGSISVDKLPVKYCSNRTAWIHSWCFEYWVKSLDRKMMAGNRHILLFVDKAPVHPNITLRNNCTSVLQPMDAGIIQTLKLKYRKRQLVHVLSEMDRNSSQTDPEILRKCGFGEKLSSSTSDHEEIRTLADVDSNVYTCDNSMTDWGRPASQILSEMRNSDETSSNFDDKEEEEYLRFGKSGFNK